MTAGAPGAGTGRPGDARVPEVLEVTGGRPLRGRVRVPGDKSISHRALLAAARAEGRSVLRGLSDGEDVAHTAAALRALGAGVERAGEVTVVEGGPERLHEPDRVLDLGNSGTGIRLLAGFCAALEGFFVLTGDASVVTRPMARVAVPLRRMGATVDGRGKGRLPPLAVRGGGLKGIDYTPEVPSAQVKSALLFAGLGASGETVVREPVPTRAHTEELLADCGAAISVEDLGAGRLVRVKASALSPLELEVPGDPSQAAFFVVAAVLVEGSEVVLEDVYLGPGRDGFLEVLARMGAQLEVVRKGPRRADLLARHARLRATEVRGGEVPGLIDEIPVLAVAAALAEGTTTFRDAAELRVKESDRVATVAEGLAALGAEVEERPDGLAVTGRPSLAGAVVDAHGDHRVAMAMAVAGLAATGTTTVTGFRAVATSYPGFAEDLARLSGAVRWR